jgi:heme/copper-type cytochrome/quinol oxidase subunit 3
MRSKPDVPRKRRAAAAAVRMAACVLVAYGMLAFFLLVTLAPESESDSLAHGTLRVLLLLLSSGGVVAATSAVARAGERSLTVALACLALGTLLLFIWPVH